MLNKKIYTSLKENITLRKVKIAIVGLGYVGLPLALAFLKRGFFVFGFDTNTGRIKKLKKGISYIVDVDTNKLQYFIKRSKFYPTHKESILGEAEVIIICVPTPLKKVKIPDISYIVQASRIISRYLRRGQLIILESTSYPTTTRKVVLPILEKSTLSHNEDFFLCFSSERVNPGDKKHPLNKIPKLVGGVSKAATSLGVYLYSQIINKVYAVSSPEIAEAAKLLENTYRLVNIALANEFAFLCHKLNIDVWEVIKAASTKPFGFMPFYPGAVGGHCIPADPIYLSWKAKKVGFKTRMIDLASYINHYMPHYIIERLIEALSARSLTSGKKKDIFSSRILILGVTYKKDVKDLREAPALDIMEELWKRNIKVDYFDPFIPYLDIAGIRARSIKLTKRNIKKYDCLLLLTDHSSLDYNFIRREAKFIFDTRNVYKKDFSNVRRL